MIRDGDEWESGESTSDGDAFLGHDLDHLGHVVKILFVGLQALEHGFDTARLTNHHVAAEVAIGCGSVNDTSLDLIATTRSHNGGFTIDVEVELPLQHEIGLIPGVGVRGLANTAGCCEFGNAVFSVGLLSGEPQCDGVSQHIAHFWFLVQRAGHVGRNKAFCF